MCLLFFYCFLKNAQIIIMQIYLSPVVFYLSLISFRIKHRDDNNSSANYFCIFTAVIHLKSSHTIKKAHFYYLLNTTSFLIVLA